MTRANKPYSRPSGGSDGAWTHDAYEGPRSTPSLSSRLSGSGSSINKGKGRAGGDLLSRISGGQGKELLPTSRSKGMVGFGVAPPVNANNANSGLELLPSGQNGPDGRLNAGSSIGPVRRGGKLVQMSHGLVNSAMASALNPQRTNSAEARKNRPKELFPNRAGARRDEERLGSGVGFEQESRERYDQPRQAAVSSISVMGHSQPKSVWVRVDNLAQGTTPEDVVSAFAPVPITASRTAQSSTNLICVEIELSTQAEADQIVSTYDGVVADGNALKVEIVRQPLGSRLGGARQESRTTGPASAPTSRSAGRGGDVDMDVDEDLYGSDSRRDREERAGRGDRETMGGGSGSRMYSDSILASNPVSHIVTLASDDAGQRQRASAWPSAPGHSRQSQGGSLASRVGGGQRW